MSAPRAPQPPGLPWLGHVVPFRRDVLGLLTSARARHGDLVRFHLGPIVLHLAAHPDLVRQVLVERTERYDKETRSSRKIRGLTGLSLLTANGGEWQRRRRLIQPAFRPEALAALVPRMSQAVAERRDAWREHAAARRPLDLSSELARLTFTLVGRALFSSEVGGEAAPVERAMAVLLAEIYRRFERLVDLPRGWPTPGRRRFARALAKVDRIVYGILEARRRKPATDDGDLLDRLLADGARRDRTRQPQCRAARGAAAGMEPPRHRRRPGARRRRPGPLRRGRKAQPLAAPAARPLALPRAVGRRAAHPLGDAHPPAGLAPTVAAQAETAIRTALVDAFRRACLFSAALCALGAGVAWAWLPARTASGQVDRHR